MTSASKTTYGRYYLKILRPKVTKNINNLRKKFCEFRPCFVKSTYGSNPGVGNFQILVLKSVAQRVHTKF